MARLSPISKLPPFKASSTSSFSYRATLYFDRIFYPQSRFVSLWFDAPCWLLMLKFLRSFVYAIRIPETFLERKHIAFAQSLTSFPSFQPSASFFEKVQKRQIK